MDTRITKEKALAEIRKFLDLEPAGAPAVPAMRLMLHIDSWEEHSAILAAYHQVLEERS